MLQPSFIAEMTVMNRRQFIHTFALYGALNPFALRAQRPAPRVAYLTTLPGRTEFEEAFLDGLRALGYVDGKSILIDYRWKLDTEERLRAALTELVDLKVDVIVTTGLGIARAAKSATSTIPIVMTTAGDPVGAGLVANLARPGGNVTGYSMYTSELTRKRLQVFKEAVPALERVGALFNERTPVRPGGALEETEVAGGMLNVKVVALPTRLPEGIGAAFTQARRSGLQGVVILSDQATIAHRAELGASAIEHRVPTMFANKLYLKGGGLMSYGPDILEAFRRTAFYVDRIVKGARPGDLPIELAAKFELAISQKTAKAIGVTIPPSLLALADHLM